MTSLLEWLLSLEQIRWGKDAPLHLRWEILPPPWVIASFSILVVGAVFLVYRRERTSLPRRILLTALRCLLIAIVAAALCGPALVLERNRVEASHVALLVDTSLSMARRDVEEHHKESRLDAIKAALRRDGGAPLRQLLERNSVQLLTFADRAESRGFAASVRELPAVLDVLSELVPEGSATDLAAAIDQTLAGTQGRRLAAIVLASDGRSTAAGSLKDSVDRARGRQVPVYSLRVGSPIRPIDVELGGVRAEPTVYLQDQIAVAAKICATGLASATRTQVRMVDDQLNAPASTQTVTLAGEPAVPPNRGAEAPSPSGESAEGNCIDVELRTKPARLGALRYRIEVDPLPGEEITDNNFDTVDVSIMDAKLRVLYVDGYPRYEYRYLKNALLREPTVELSVLLLEADQQFVQEGSDPIRRFPESPEELGRYDAVLFGDVDPRAGWLTPAQVTMLLDYVANDGGGFGLIAGERFAPQRFLGTPLEKLIPVRIDPEFLGHYEGTITNGFQVVLTAEARATRLLQNPSSLTLDSGSQAEDERFFESLPPLYWIAKTEGTKPGAAVIAQHPVLRTRGDRDGSSQPMPILIVARYGAGRIFFQATDDTWRWRRHRTGSAPSGELMHDLYWLQVARWLSPARRATQDPRFSIRADRRVYRFGDRVRVEVEVLDSQLLNQTSESLRLTLSERSRPEVDNSNPLDRTERGRAFSMARLEAGRRSPESLVFEAACTPPRPGLFAVTVDDFPVASGDPIPAALFRVDRPALETRRPEADHETLALIAESTGGRVLELDQLETGFATIRDRRVQIPDDVVESLSDSKLALLLFVLIISIEWILRKGFGLL